VRNAGSAAAAEAAATRSFLGAGAAAAAGTRAAARATTTVAFELPDRSERAAGARRSVGRPTAEMQEDIVGEGLERGWVVVWRVRETDERSNGCMSVVIQKRRERVGRVGGARGRSRGVEVSETPRWQRSADVALIGWLSARFL